MSSSLSLAVVRRRKGHSERVHALLQKNRRTFDMKFLPNMLPGNGTMTFLEKVELVTKPAINGTSS